MCGKFTSMASWTQIVDFIHATPPAQADGNDRSIIFRVMGPVPVIVLHEGKRRSVPMRWGFPHPQDWKRPQPIHARAETIDTTQAFAAAFCDGQRGIVLVESFNEAPDVEGPTIQHTITPAGPVGIAFVWRRFDVPSGGMLACVMVTVPANPLIVGLPTDRMPAVLAPGDWATWLGEGDATVAQAKACLRTVEDVHWTMTREERAAKTRRAKPTVSDPTGLF
jgi:putative SOS response-associated peptidase YedK